MFVKVSLCVIPSVCVIHSVSPMSMSALLISAEQNNIDFVSFEDVGNSNHHAEHVIVFIHVCDPTFSLLFP